MKLKKLVVAGIMCLSIVSLTSCNKEKLAGTELAKILLAQERLDSENVKNTGNLFSTGAKALKRIEKDAKDYNENVRRLANKKEKPRTEVNGNTIRWYNDEEYSNIGSYFENYSSNIESMAKQSGDLIDYVKNNIRVTDKWIKNGSSEVLLQVDFESETIFERIENQYEICRRYTNDHGLDVYDIFRYTNLHDSKMRMKYIPGQVYEFAMSADWATYYLIANCFDGEWTIMTNTRRYGTSIDTPDYFNENFDIISLKDDIGLRTHMTVDGFNGERGEVENFTEGDIKLMSSDAKLDLFDMEDSYNFTIKNTSVNGIDYFEHSGVITEDHNNVNADILKLDGGTYTSITPPKVILKNGMILKTGDKLSNGKFEITNLNISNFAGMESVGEISFQVNAEEEPSSLFAYLYEFMDVCGLSFKREKDAILSVENLADVRAKNFINNFRWNGYSLNNKDNIIAVFNLEDKKITDLLALYEGVKNNSSISKSSQAALDKNVVFPNTTLKSSNVVINDRTVSVSNIEIEVESSTLFEDTEKYKLSVGLAKEVNGELVDFIPMYNCGEFTLSQSYLNTLIVNENIEFTLPDLEDGKFILSSTIVTEEGIRVSKPVALNVNVFDTFETSAYGYLNSYKFVDNTLVIETSLDSTIYLNINKEVGLTYLRNEMISYAIKRGDVNDNTIEQLADGNWAVLKDVDKLPNGQYRMKYVVDGKEEYVYANIIIGG
jgi:hypothetical protein